MANYKIIAMLLLVAGLTLVRALPLDDDDSNTKVDPPRHALPPHLQELLRANANSNSQGGNPSEAGSPTPRNRTTSFSDETADDETHANENSRDSRQVAGDGGRPTRPNPTTPAPHRIARQAGSFPGAGSSSGGRPQTSTTSTTTSRPAGVKQSGSGSTSTNRPHSRKSSSTSTIVPPIVGHQGAGGVGSFAI